MVGIAAFVMFYLTLAYASGGAKTLSNFGTIEARTPLVKGLPFADVYVVRNDNAGNYFTINGSDTTQVLETNTNPVTAINDAITHWVPINGKLVTNGTMADWDGTVQPTHGNFTWEAWKTVATQTASLAPSSVLFGVNIYYDFITINNFTYIGENSSSIYEFGIRTIGANYLTVENSTITKCSYEAFQSAAILVGGGTGHSIRYNNVSFNFDIWAIVMNVVTNSVASHNYVDCDGNGAGIGSFGSDSVLTGSNNCTFNTILNWGENPDTYGESMYWHAIYYSSEAYDYIYNNTMQATDFSSTGGAMLVKGAYFQVFNNTFAGGNIDCAISAYQQGANWWNSPNGTMIYNNTIANYPLGILLSGLVGNITIANNTITNCPTGMLLASASTSIYPENITLIGNRISTGTYGIRMGYSSNAESYSNNIHVLNNAFTSITTAVQTYTNTINPTIEYNTFSSCPTPVTSGSTNPTFRFNVGLAGYYMLNVTVVGSGSTSPSGLGWQYKSGSTASVTWTPDTGHVRQNISIDGTNQSTTASPLDVTMSANHVVIAYFVSAP